MSLYEMITSKLNEMADTKKEITESIHNKEWMISEHLIKCMLYPKSENINHWKVELYGFVHNVNKVKGTNKYPSYKQLYKWVLNRFEDSLLDRIDGYVSDITRKYGNVEYNKQMLYDKIIEYFKWLLQNLSEKGYVTRQEVSDKIDILIKRGDYK